MSKPNGRRVRMAEFKAQVAEAVLPPDGMVDVEIGEGVDQVVRFRVPIKFDGTSDDYVDQIRACETSEQMAEVVLGDEQLAAWTAAGFTAEDFALLLAEETNAAQERMRDFRYRKSGR